MLQHDVQIQMCLERRPDTIFLFAAPPPPPALPLPTTTSQTVGSYNKKGALAQYAASRSCQKSVDAADTALRGALVKLSVSQSLARDPTLLSMLCFFFVSWLFTGRRNVSLRLVSLYIRTGQFDPAVIFLLFPASWLYSRVIAGGFQLQVGQGAELMSMVGRLQDAGLVVDEKLDMIIEHLRKQEENAARLELRLAEYSESMAEVNKHRMKRCSLVWGVKPFFCCVQFSFGRESGKHSYGGTSCSRAHSPYFSPSLPDA